MRVLAFAAALAAAAAPSFAAEPPSDPSQRTRYGLYLTAAEAYALKQGPRRVALVDVRDPIEAMFTGVADATDVYVPWMTADRATLDPKKGVYRMVPNPAFAAELAARLAAAGADKTTPLVIMCRSGSTRSAPVADLLHTLGYAEVYSMVDGFEGEPIKAGPHAGVRLVGGWRNSGLPWSYRLPVDKAWTPAAR